MKKIPFQQYLESGENIKFTDDGKILDGYDKTVITDRNIYCFNIETTIGFFKKSESLKVEKYPVKDIFIENNIPKIAVTPDRDENIFIRMAKEFDPTVIMVISFTEESDLDDLEFDFSDDSIRTNFDCAERIKKLLYEAIISQQIHINGFSNISMDNAVIPSSKKKKKGKEKNQPAQAPPKAASIKCIGCHAPLHGMKGQHIVCEYCDTKQVI